MHSTAFPLPILALRGTPVGPSSILTSFSGNRTISVPSGFVMLGREGGVSDIFLDFAVFVFCVFAFKCPTLAPNYSTRISLRAIEKKKIMILLYLYYNFVIFCFYNFVINFFVLDLFVCFVILFL